jgi:hypothetical protein
MILEISPSYKKNINEYSYIFEILFKALTIVRSYKNSLFREF